MPRLLGSILLALVLNATPATAQNRDDIRFAETGDLVGAWEVVPYPPGAAGPFEYLVILGTGRIGTLTATERRAGLTQREMMRMIDPITPNAFQMSDGKMTIFYSRIPGLREIWAVHMVTRDFSGGGVQHRVGDAIMLRDDGQGGITRSRHLRKLPD